MKMLTQSLLLILNLVWISTPLSCLQNCKQCKTPQQCQTCMDGFYLYSPRYCRPCPKQCTSCRSDQNGHPYCLGCIANSYLKDGQCLVCKPPCKSCSWDKNGVKCVACPDGYSLSPLLNQGSCIKNNMCNNINHCNKCQTFQNNLTVPAIKKTFCKNCQFGFFTYRPGCDRCHHTCSDCQIANKEALWKEVSTYWQKKIQILRAMHADDNETSSGSRRLLDSSDTNLQPSQTTQQIPNPNIDNKDDNSDQSNNQDSDQGESNSQQQPTHQNNQNIVGQNKDIKGDVNENQNKEQQEKNQNNQQDLGNDGDKDSKIEQSPSQYKDTDATVATDRDGGKDTTPKNTVQSAQQPQQNQNQQQEPINQVQANKIEQNQKKQIPQEVENSSQSNKQGSLMEQKIQKTDPEQKQDEQQDETKQQQKPIQILNKQQKNVSQKNKVQSSYNTAVLTQSNSSAPNNKQISESGNNSSNESLPYPLEPPPFKLFNTSFDQKSKISQAEMKGWTEAYFFMKYLENLVQKFSFVQSHWLILPALQRIVNFGFNYKQQYFNLQQQLSATYNFRDNLYEIQQRMNALAIQKTKCKVCKEGYYLTRNAQDQSKCYPCSYKCKTCADSKTCLQCASGFYIETDKTCSRCSLSCRQCSGTSGNCISCDPPRILSYGGCIYNFCARDCLTCSTSNNLVCLTCNCEYSYLPNNGTCFKCKDNNCRHCNQSNIDICYSCKPGYYLQNNNNNPTECIKCTAACQQCVVDQGKLACYKCESNYSLVDGKCTKCEAECKVCYPTNPKMCLQCETFQYKDQETSICKNCPHGCLTCQNPQNCTKYQDSFTISQGKKTRCETACLQCSEQDITVCQVCAQRYFLSNQFYCKPCPSNCYICINQTQCLTCAPEAFFKNGQCTLCSMDCKICNEDLPSFCINCAQGYVAQSGKCVQAKCSEGCLICPQRQQKQACFQCIRGYTRTQNYTCLKCVDTCTGVCNPLNVSECILCSLGEYLKENKCYNCPNNCLSCTENRCFECDEGYTLCQQKKMCHRECLFPCATCNQQFCATCQKGYILKKGKCINNLSYRQSTNYCLSGSCFNTKSLKCQQCPSNCGSCTCQQKKCQICYDGYYLDSNNSCISCPNYCYSCYNSQFCRVCAPGFVKQIWQMGITMDQIIYGTKCIPCKGNCLTCQIYPDRCTSCKTGTKLYSSKCIFGYKIAYQFQLDQEYETFIHSMMLQSFRYFLVNFLHILPSDLQVHEIKEGSTILKGIILSETNYQAKRIKEMIQKQVKKEGKLFQLKVLSFNTQLYYNDRTQTNPMQQEEQDNSLQQYRQIQNNFNFPVEGIIISSIVSLFAIILGVLYFLCRKWMFYRVSKVAFQKYDDQMAPKSEDYIIKHTQGSKKVKKQQSQKHINGQNF